MKYLISMLAIVGSFIGAHYVHNEGYIWGIGLLGGIPYSATIQEIALSLIFLNVPRINSSLDKAP